MWPDTMLTDSWMLLRTSSLHTGLGSQPKQTSNVSVPIICPSTKNGHTHTDSSCCAFCRVRIMGMANFRNAAGMAASPLSASSSKNSSRTKWRARKLGTLVPLDGSTPSAHHSRTQTRSPSLGSPPENSL